MPDDINQEAFDQLLAWLHPDREKSAERYEWIRKRLIKIFSSRGSHTPDDLADATINRVAKKLSEVLADYQGEPAHYFQRVANYIWLEHLRNNKHPAVVPPLHIHDEQDEADFECLEKCLAELPASDRALVLAYYEHEKTAKIDHRKKLAEQLGLALNALRIRACRIRASLLNCLELCRSGGQA
jgi:DNA-directed RNA polymerase specialized sigma24 family protein